MRIWNEGSHLRASFDRPVSAWSLPDKPRVKSPTPEGYDTWLAWANPNEKSRFGCPQQPAPLRAALSCAMLAIVNCIIVHSAAGLAVATIFFYIRVPQLKHDARAQQ